MTLRFFSHKINEVCGYLSRNPRWISFKRSGTFARQFQSLIHRNAVEKRFHTRKRLAFEIGRLSWLSPASIEHVDLWIFDRFPTINSGVKKSLLKSFNKIFQQKSCACWKILLKGENHHQTWFWPQNSAPPEKVELIPWPMRYRHRDFRSCTLLRSSFQQKWRLVERFCGADKISNLSDGKKKR